MCVYCVLCTVSSFRGDGNDSCCRRSQNGPCAQRGAGPLRGPTNQRGMLAACRPCQRPCRGAIHGKGEELTKGKWSGKGR